MKFLISVIDSRDNLADGDEMAAIDAFNQKLQDNGHFVLALGLYEPERATVIDNRAGAGAETGKPLFESAEHYSGMWIITADNIETARELAFEASLACNRKVELRQFHGK